MKKLACMLILSLSLLCFSAQSMEPLPGVSLEAQSLPVISMPPSFWQEFDITFWQTAPFAVFWTYLIDGQASNLLMVGAAPHWEVILATSALISAGNAYWQAQRRSNNGYF